MSSRNKEMQARTEGMAYALRIAKEKGIEELEKEIKFRNLTGISLNLSRKDLNYIQTIKEELKLELQIRWNK